MVTEASKQHTIVGEGTGTTVHVDISLLAAQDGEPTANTLNAGQGIGDLHLTINVGVQHTQNVLEIVRLQCETL